MPDCQITIFRNANCSGSALVFDGPAEFRDLSNLPGAMQCWANQIGGLRTGLKCWAILYEEENFQGASVIITPGGTLLPRGVDEKGIFSIKLFRYNPEAFINLN